MLPSLVYNKIIEGSHAGFLDPTLVNYLASFPKESYVKTILKKSFIINKPMNKVGGDGYWLYDSGKEVFLVVFDCMGHGPLASIMTRKYIKVIDKVIKEEKFEDPCVILQQIHAKLASEFGDLTDDRVGSGADMAVLSFAPDKRILRYSGAKMDLAKISDGQLFFIKADKLQVGEIFDRQHLYNTIEMKLPKKKDSTFFLYTDGVTDLMGGENNKKLGKRRLTKILERAHFLPVMESKDFIEKQLNNWMGEQMQIDDLLMIGLTI